MILRPDTSPRYWDFQVRWGVPLGHPQLHRRVAFSLAKLARVKTWQAKAIGPFGFQPDNSATRGFEYPWAFYVVPILPEHTIVDLGGSLGGLQFVLSKHGARVINVDPSEQADMGWPVDQGTIRLLNHAFGTKVELRQAFLENAGLVGNSVDRIYCISTIEHIPVEMLSSLVKEVKRILKPGGFVVMTIDLFFDLWPFTKRDSNACGTNIDVRWLVEESGLELYIGERSELNGYPEFQPERILSRAMEFALGDTALNVAQALVLRKPAFSD